MSDRHRVPLTDGELHRLSVYVTVRADFGALFQESEPILRLMQRALMELRTRRGQEGRRMSTVPPTRAICEGDRS